MLFSFPPEAQSERSAFTVVGQARPGGALAGEVMLVPDEALPEEGFSGCVFYLDERRLARLPVCTRTLIPEALAARFRKTRSICPPTSLAARFVRASRQRRSLRRTALVYHSPAVAFFHAPLPVRRGSARIAGGGRPPDTARRAGVQPRTLLHVLPRGVLRQGWTVSL